MILENKIKCKKCGQIVVSGHRHDFKVCKCGACAADGGFTYLRRMGDAEDWEEQSIVKNFKWEKPAKELREKLFEERASEEIMVNANDLHIILNALDDYSLACARYLWLLKNGTTL